MHQDWKLKSSKDDKDLGFGFGQRHILVFFGFLGYALSYSMRFNLSIAIVAMVSNNTEELSKPDVILKNDYCHHNLQPIPVNDSMQVVYSTNTEPLNLPTSNYTSTLSQQGEFDWSESEQGFILGSFFYGYLITQIPGGWLGHKFGGKWPFGLGLLINAILAIVTPFAARIGGFTFIVAVRILQGFAGGITVPCMHGLLAKWVPPNERGKLTAFVYAGMPFGTSVSLIVSGYIIRYLGWAWVFYGTGLATIVWFILWVTLTASSPSDHSRISEKELDYIQRSIDGDNHKRGISSSAELPKRLPWGKIFKSGPFWAVIFGQLTETWGLYTIMTELPTYMKTVLHYDIEENSLLSAFPHLLTWGVSIVLTNVGDYFIRKRYASIGTVRKSCNTIGMWGSAAALLCVAYSGCDRVITVTLLFIAVGCTGGIIGGVLVNLIDITPNYAGMLMGITNTAGTIPGVIAPWVAGIIINNDPSLEKWRIVFFITATISFIGNSLFLLLASGEEQSWNHPQQEEINSSKNPKDSNDLDYVDMTTFYTAPINDAATYTTTQANDTLCKKEEGKIP